MKGGSEAPQREAKVATPTESDPAVQKKKASRMTQARYAQGYRSTIASGKPDQGLGQGGAAAAPGTVGTMTKLG